MSSDEKPGGSPPSAGSTDSGRGDRVPRRLPCLSCLIYICDESYRCCTDIAAGGDGNGEAKCERCKQMGKICFISKEPCFPGLKVDTPPKGFEDILSALNQKPIDPAAIQEAEKILGEALRGGMCYLGKLAMDALSKGMLVTGTGSDPSPTELADMWADMAGGETYVL